MFHRLNFEGFPIHALQLSEDKGSIPFVWLGGAFQDIRDLNNFSMEM